MTRLLNHLVGNVCPALLEIGLCLLVGFLLVLISALLFPFALVCPVRVKKLLERAPPPPADDDQAVTVKRYSIWSATGGVTRECPDALGARRVC